MANERSLNFEGKNSPEKKEGFRNHLFVIGIDEYVHIPRLENAVEDARDFSELLISQYQFDRENFTFLCNAEATFRNIKDTFRRFAQTLTEEDNLVIFFSGHGMFDKVLDQGYWLPVDAERDSSAFYISNSDLATYLRAIRSFHTLLISDSCFSGTLFARSRDFSDRVGSLPSRWGLASGRDEPVSDGGSSGNSPFTENLLYFLRRNDKPALPVSELVQFVKQAVANNSAQTPLGSPLQDVGDKGGEFIFRSKNAGQEQSPPNTSVPKPDEIRKEPKPPMPEGERPPQQEKRNVGVQPEFTLTSGKSGEAVVSGFTGEILSLAVTQNRYLVADTSGHISAFNPDGKFQNLISSVFNEVRFAPGGQKILTLDQENRRIRLLSAAGSILQEWQGSSDSAPGDMQAEFADNGNFLVRINGKLFINGKETRFGPGAKAERFFLQSSTRNVCPNSISVDPETEKKGELCDFGFFALVSFPESGISEVHFLNWNGKKEGKMDMPLLPDAPEAWDEILTGGPYMSFMMKDGSIHTYFYDGPNKTFRSVEYAIEFPENGPVWRAAGGYLILGNPEGNPDGSAFRNYWLNADESSGKLMAFEYYSTRKESFFLALFENGDFWKGSLDLRQSVTWPAFSSGIRVDKVFVRNLNESILFALSDSEGNIRVVDFQQFRNPQWLMEEFSPNLGRISKLEIADRDKLIVASVAGQLAIFNLPLQMKNVIEIDPGQGQMV